MADYEYYGVPPTNTRDVENRYRYVAGGGATTFSANYALGYVDVYYNGSHLDSGSAYAAASGTSIVLTNPATAGAIVEIVCRRQVPIYTGVPISLSGPAAVRYVYEITASANQTSFSPTTGYTVGAIDVYINGARLSASDYTATDGLTVVLGSGCVAGDVFTSVAYSSFSISNNYTQSQSDARYLQPSQAATIYAPINSPVFTGTPQLTTTPASLDNTTNLASTAFVFQANMAALLVLAKQGAL